MEKDILYKRAQEKAKMLKDLYSHVIVYLAFNSGLFLINYFTFTGEWWVLYPVIGWGFCLTIGAIDTYSKVYRFGSEWENRKTDQLVQKELERKNK